MCAISDFLLEAMNLKTLKLARNHISDEGARVLCQTLLHANVQMLDLSFNELGVRAFGHLSILVQHNKRLKGVCLKGNNIDARTKVKMITEFKAAGVLLEL